MTTAPTSERSVMEQVEQYANDTVSFEEPPPRRDRRYDWRSIAKELEQNPGMWAKVFEKDRASLATAIRIGSITAMQPDRGIEIRTTNNVREPVRTCTLWARYVPEQDRRGESDGG